MKKIVLILTLLMMTILMMGCNELNVQESENPDVLQVEEESVATEKEELKVTIESKVKDSFTHEPINFTPVLEGKVDKELEYHWTVERVPYIEDEDILEGFVGESGPVTEVINSGEPVEYGIYAEISYVEGAYIERNVTLNVKEKDTGKVVATDELIIENREGIYSIRTSKDDELISTILKTSKARLYAKIFDTVWGIDSGLNCDVKYISVDTKTFEEFDKIDKAQLFEYIEKRYDAEVLDMTMDELEDAGYIKDMSFIDGIAFSIDKYIVNSENKVSFEGRKWASGMGAIGFIAEGEYKNGQWEIIRCDMTWIS